MDLRTLTRFRRGPGLACVLLLGAILPSASADEALSKEYQFKAAFLYNFTKFVEWPEASFARPDDPIHVGVYCGEELADALRKIVEGRKVNGRALLVNRLVAARDAQSAHLVFVCADADALLPAIESAVRSGPVVTVGDDSAAAAQGVVIRFLLEHDKVRFAIDMDAAELAGVKISAQLQKLAMSVQATP